MPRNEKLCNIHHSNALTITNSTKVKISLFTSRFVKIYPFSHQTFHSKEIQQKIIVWREKLCNFQLFSCCSKFSQSLARWCPKFPHISAVPIFIFKMHSSYTFEPHFSENDSTAATASTKMWRNTKKVFNSVDDLGIVEKLFYQVISLRAHQWTRPWVRYFTFESSAIFSLFHTLRAVRCDLKHTCEREKTWQNGSRLNSNELNIRTHIDRQSRTCST